LIQAVYCDVRTDLLLCRNVAAGATDEAELIVVAQPGAAWSEVAKAKPVRSIIFTKCVRVFGAVRGCFLEIQGLVDFVPTNPCSPVFIRG
jgi:hypothetical protein